MLGEKTIHDNIDTILDILIGEGLDHILVEVNTRNLGGEEPGNGPDETQ